MINSIKKLIKRYTPTFSTTVGVYQYSNINNPLLTDYLTNNSVTCQVASNIMTNFVMGYGVDGYNHIKINDKQTLFNFISDLSKSLTNYRGAFIHRNLNAGGETTTLRIIPFASCRIGKKDDANYNGKIAVKQDWEDDSEKMQLFDVWNEKKNVINSQFKEQGEKYKGQILYINFDEHLIYPFPRLTPVINDAYAEIQAGVYKKAIMDNGFLSKYWVITPPFADNLVDGIEMSGKQLRNDFINKFEGLLGVENAGKIMHSEFEFDSIEDLEKNIVIKELKQNVDDQAFAGTEASARANILMTFGVPKILVSANDNNIFGNSGELIKQAKLYYQQATERDRREVELILTKIFKMFNKKELQIDFKIKPLIKGNEIIS